MMRRKTNSDDDNAVAETLERLCDELAVLRQVLDDIYCELQWANRNRPDRDSETGTGCGITSMPLDPTTPDWAELLNRFSAADLPSEEAAPPAEGHLF